VSGDLSAVRPIENRMTYNLRLQWEAQGYFTVKGALTDQECDTLHDLIAAEYEIACAAPAGDPRLTAKRFTMDAVALRGEPFVDLIDHPSTFGIVLDLMGDNIRAMATMAMVRPPVTFDQRDWHVDGPYPHQYPQVRGGAPLLELNIIFALHDVNTSGAGNFTVVPGSHHLQAPPTDQFADKQNDVAGAVELMQEKGDATFFHNAIWHTAGNNRSSRPRVNLFYTYCYVWMHPYDYADVPGPLASRLNPVQRLLLLGPPGSDPRRFQDEAGGFWSLSVDKEEKMR
jgi:ectoine hydroxylase